MNSAQKIPTADLNDFLSEDRQRRAFFIDILGKAYEEIGFIAIENYGLSEDQNKKLYRQVQQFFELPLQLKQQYEIEGLAGQRGYTSFGKEHAKGQDAGDLKEFWHFGQYGDDEGLIDKYPKNIEVRELPEFNIIGRDVYLQLEESAKQILRAIAIYLNLDENYFDIHIHNGNSILRPIHYPAITAEPDGAVRAAEHEDINLITLLMGSSAEGLEVLSKSGEWIPVRALPGQIIVNVGDMLQRLTNNKLRSTTHRVVNPPREKWGLPRYSIPFFLHPRREMPLNCLDECIDDNHPKQYENISAGEYLDERLKEIGLKK